MKLRYRLIVLFATLIAQIVRGQSAARGVNGTVLDPSGAVIPGAQVVVMSQDGRSIARTSTGKTGSFSFDTVPTGSYIVDVTKDGFREVKQPTKVGAGAPIQLRIVMSIAAIAEEMTVASPDGTAQVSTEIALNQSANRLDSDALDRVPIFDQDYITTMSRFLDADSTGTNGVSLVVNGVEANGPGVTASAIQSVKINQNPYTAL